MPMTNFMLKGGVCTVALLTFGNFIKPVYKIPREQLFRYDTTVTEIRDIERKARNSISAEKGFAKSVFEWNNVKLACTSSDGLLHSVDGRPSICALDYGQCMRTTQVPTMLLDNGSECYHDAAGHLIDIKFGIDKKHKHVPFIDLN